MDCELDFPRPKTIIGPGPVDGSLGREMDSQDGRLAWGDLSPPQVCQVKVVEALKVGLQRLPLPLQKCGEDAQFPEQAIMNS